MKKIPQEDPEKQVDHEEEKHQEEFVELADPAEENHNEKNIRVEDSKDWLDRLTPLQRHILYSDFWFNTVGTYGISKDHKFYGFFHNIERHEL